MIYPKKYRAGDGAGAQTVTVGPNNCRNTSGVHALAKQATYGAFNTTNRRTSQYSFFTFVKYKSGIIFVGCSRQVIR